ISENASRARMKKTAEALQDELKKLPMLKNVEIHGLPEQIVRVELRLDRIAQMNIPLQAIMGSIQSQMANIPGGSVLAGSKMFSVKTSGNYRSLEEIQNTVVYAVNGRNILLKDIADAFITFDETKHITRLNGHRSLFVVAAQKPGYNISKTKEAYTPVLERFNEHMPNNIDMIVNFDQADNVNSRLSGLGKDFIIAIFLVAITLLPLGMR